MSPNLRVWRPKNARSTTGARKRTGGGRANWPTIIRERRLVYTAAEGRRDEAPGRRAVPRFVPRERGRLEERAGPDEQEFDWHEEADDMDTGTGPTGRARSGNGSDDSREGDVAESRVEDDMRRCEEALPAHDDMAPDVPVQSEGLEEQAGERKREDGPSGHAGQRTEEPWYVHRWHSLARSHRPANISRPANQAAPVSAPIRWTAMRSSASRRSREAVSGVSRSSCRTSTAPGKAAATRNERVRGSISLQVSSTIACPPVSRISTIPATRRATASARSSTSLPGGSSIQSTSARKYARPRSSDRMVKRRWPSTTMSYSPCTLRWHAMIDASVPTRRGIA